MYETIKIVDDNNIEITSFFDGFKIELFTFLVDNGERNLLADLYIYSPDLEENWVNIWGIVKFTKPFITPPKFMAEQCSIDVTNVDENEQNQFQELLEKWLKNPEFIEKINEMAKKLAVYINARLAIKQM